MIKSICFLTTYTCNARCDFCECGPDVRERLALSDIIRPIDEAASLGTIRQVVFSGGEPTLLGSDLFRAIEHATKLRLLTRVVTNGWWGKTPDKALQMVDQLRDAGLSEINISVDDLHQRWIPLERVRNAFLACYQRRLKCLIAHKGTKSSTITKPFLEQHFGVELIDLLPRRAHSEEEDCRLISTGTVIPVGRNDDKADLADHIYTDWRGNCGAVLRDIVVGANNRLLPCCGIVTKNIPELTRSDLRTTPLIDAIEDANRDLILNWIALEGPAAIIEFVKSRDQSVEFADEYVGICHACNDVLTRPEVRSVLVRHVNEVVDRVTLHRAFLELVREDDELSGLYTRE